MPEHGTTGHSLSPRLRRWLLCFYLFLGALLVVDLAIEKHGDFHWESAPGFFAVYGFLCYVGLIFTAKTWRRLDKRKEDYYDTV
jgi:hypothetical protein